MYTKRREDLRTHPGQISFPGGRVEPGEDVVSAALREAEEEIGLDPASTTPMGASEAVYVPPSRYWLQTVVARWDRPHPLVPQESEVAEILHVPLATLRDADHWRAVRLSASGRTWAWALDGGHTLWGATAMITAALLDVIEPGWSGHVDPLDLGAEREVRPWLDHAPRAPQRSRVDRLPVLGTVAYRDPHSDESPTLAAVEEAGQAVAEAVRDVTAEAGARVLVLAGPGGSGEVARAAAGFLGDTGDRVTVVASGRPLSSAPTSDGVVTHAVVEQPFAGTLPAADVVVDGLVGAGLRGPLRDPVRAVVMGLRRLSAPVVSLDVPTGLHPTRGLVGEALAADVTVVFDAPLPGLGAPGVAPFVGEVCVARGGALVGRLPPEGGLAPGWRE